MSAKTSNQPGRRTPLSLSGGVTKSGSAHNNRGSNAPNNTNGHANNPKDNKNQLNNKTEQPHSTAQKQQQLGVDAKENPTKLQNKQPAVNAESKIPKLHQQQSSDHAKQQKQVNQNEKKQMTSDKQQQQQNGMSNSLKGVGNPQQQTNKEKLQVAEGEIKSDEKESKKTEITQNKHESDEKDNDQHGDKAKIKIQENSEKDDKKQKMDRMKQDKEKDEVIQKGDKIESGHNPESAKITSSHIKDIEVGTDSGCAKKSNEAEKIHVVENDGAVQDHRDQKMETNKSAPLISKSTKDSVPSTPTKLKSNKAEKTPQRHTPTKREVTTCIDDFEMESLVVENLVEVTDLNVKNEAGLAPCASSTPGKSFFQKSLGKTTVQLPMQSSITPERPRAFSQISGRRAIRPITDYTPSKFQSNSQFRESYRRVNTELDVTNTSLNVTVGSEIPNNASFSFFGRGRKRDRTPPKHSQSAIGEVQSNEMETSPPKRARLDFFTVVSSPLSLLRNRFSKASLQSSTPFKVQQKIQEKEDDVEVQNVSGVSVHEDLENSTTENTTEGVGEASAGVEANVPESNPLEREMEILDNGDKESAVKFEDKHLSEDVDIKIIETPLQSVNGDIAKNKRCIVM